MKSFPAIGEGFAVYDSLREQFFNILVGDSEKELPVSRRRLLLVSVDLILMLVVVAIVAISINLFISNDDEATASSAMPQMMAGDETSQFVTSGGLAGYSATESAVDHASKHMQANYRCPLHPEVISDKPGVCPICGETLVLDSADDRDIPMPDSVSESLPTLVYQAAETEFFDKLALIEANEHRVRSIQFEGQGWVEHLVVNTVGSRVKRGDLLLEVYSPHLVDLQLEYLRALTRKDMVELTIIYDRLRSMGQTAGQIQELNQSRQADGLIRLYSPTDGLLSSINALEGMFIPPGSEVIKILDLSSVWMVVELEAAEAAKIASGQLVEISNGMRFKGEVSEVMALGGISKTYVARLRFDDEALVLRDQEYAAVRIYAKPNKPLTRR